MHTHRSRKRVVLTVMVVTVLLLAPTAASAKSQQTFETSKGLNLELDIANDGTVVVRELTLENFSLSIPIEDGNDIELQLDGLRIQNASSDNVEKALAGFGIEFELPDLKLDPQDVGMLSAYGVEHLALRKVSHEDWQELSLYINSNKSLETAVANETFHLALSQIELGDWEKDLAKSTFLEGNVQITLNFPKAKSEFAFTDEIETIDSPAPNTITTGMTISGTASAGEIISVGGVTINEINQILTETKSPTRWPYLVTNPLAVMETDTVTATAGRNGFHVASDNGHWARLDWDQEGRKAMYDLLPLILDMMEEKGMGDFPVSARDIDFNAALLESVLPKTEVNFVIHHAEEQVESGPRIQIGQLLTFELDEHGNLLYKGLPISGSSLPSRFLENLGPIALRWDGDKKEIRYSVGGVPLPPIFVGEKASVQLGDVAVGSYPEYPFLAKVPWRKLDALLGNTHLSGIVLVPAGVTPEELELNYSAKASISPQAQILPTLLLDRQGSVAIGSKQSALNLTPHLPEQVLSFTKTARQIPKGVESAAIAVDSNQVSIHLNRAKAPLMGIRWDYELRKNTFNTVDKAFGLRAVVHQTTFGILEAVFPTWEETATEMLAGGRGFQWGITVTVVDNVSELPVSPAEKLLERLGISP